MNKEKFIVGLMKVGVPASIILKMLTLTGCDKDPEPQGPQDKIIRYTIENVAYSHELDGGNLPEFLQRIAGYVADPKVGNMTFVATCEWQGIGSEGSSAAATERFQRIKHKDPGRFALADTIRPYAIFINDKTWLEANGKTVIARHVIQRQQ